MRDVSQNGSLELVIPSDPAQVRRVQDRIEKSLRAHHFEDNDIFCIKLALEEALVNAIKHGNGMDPAKTVSIQCRVSDESFEVRIMDEGPGFDPEEVPDPRAEENLERPCGRGLLLMRHYMTRVVFHPPGNRLTMFKTRHHLNGKAK